MKRIIIIGPTGSGKTTLGRKLSEKLFVPAVDLDEFNWLPDWQQRDTNDFRKLVDEATSKPSWVISGNYTRTNDIFWPRADTAIWLDYPFPLVFWRLLKRSLRRLFTKEPCCNGNTESWKKFLSKDSIMVWLFQSFYKRRRTGVEIFSNPEKYKHLRLIRFKNPAETDQWFLSVDI